MTELDLMEYVDDAAIQAEYITDADDVAIETFVAALDTDTGAYTDISLRIIIPAGKLSKSGEKVRVTIPTTATANLILDNVSIVERSGSSANGTETPTEILFSAGSGVEITAGGEATSDWLTFNIDETKDYLIIIDIGSIAAKARSRKLVEGGWGGFYYKETADSYDQQNVEGFNLDNSLVWGIKEIEVETPELQSFSEDTIKQQGSYSLKGIALITDSLNDTLTRTVSPTIDLSGLDKWIFYIYSNRTGSNIKVGIHDSGGTTTEVTPNITSAGEWQKVEVDISAVPDANKDAIDSIIITIENADAENIFFIDDMYAESVILNKTLFFGCNF